MTARGFSGLMWGMRVDAKKCTKCGEYKPLTDFTKRARERDGRHPWCKVCTSRKARAIRAAGGAVASDSAQYRRFREWLWDIKSKPCADCGNTYHPVVMQFDHLPGSEKRFNINAVPRAKARVIEEMAKCELVCANCHAIRTWERKTGETVPLDTPNAP